ncbi:MAG: acetyltransferase, partial [Bacteroidales bacterium]|nr:acetyltransferase [Bacteroidales bacterium]
MHNNLILVGGGGHCKSVIDVAEGIGWSILGILDVVENVGKTVLGYKIIGTNDHISEFIHKAYFLVSVGQIKDVGLRIKLHHKIISAGGELATITASDAFVSRHSIIEKGTVVLHKAVVNAGVKIGMGCIINTMANIEHDVVIGDYCHVSTG